MNLQITIIPDDRLPNTWTVHGSVNQDGVNHASTGPDYPCHSWADVEVIVGALLKSGHKAFKQQMEAK